MVIKINNTKMQQDVKVFTPERLMSIFPGLTVQKKSFHYNLHVDVISTIEIVKLAELIKQTGTYILMYRHGKGLTIKVAPSTPNTPRLKSEIVDVFKELGDILRP